MPVVLMQQCPWYVSGVLLLCWCALGRLFELAAALEGRAAIRMAGRVDQHCMGCEVVTCLATAW